MTAFRSRWADWQPKTPTVATDKTRKSPPAGPQTSSVGACKTRKSPFEGFEGAEGGDIPAASEPVPPCCAECGRPIDTPHGWTLADWRPIHLDCYPRWFAKVPPDGRKTAPVVEPRPGGADPDDWSSYADDSAPLPGGAA